MSQMEENTAIMFEYLVVVLDCWCWFMLDSIHVALVHVPPKKTAWAGSDSQRYVSFDVRT